MLRYLICIIFYLSPSLALSSTASTAARETAVFDNVLPEQSCDLLHNDATKVGLGHKAFTRPLINPNERSNIERVLDKILTEIGDVPAGNDEQYVEYWTRQEWRHIEAHADVDENLAKQQDMELMKNGELANIDESTFRYPTNGHVLYLKVGSEVRGPTCVFPSRSSGGALLKPVSGDNHVSLGVELITVPAKNGRLLRFEGSALHAVPRPADIWFLSFVKGAAKYTPEEEWGRSVILFNTWTKIPPRRVPLDEKSPSIGSSDDDEVGDGTVNDFLSWSETFSYDQRVSSEEEECTAAKAKDETEPPKKVKVWLLGNERRRGYPMRTVKLSGSELVREALHQTHQVSRVQLGVVE